MAGLAEPGKSRYKAKNLGFDMVIPRKKNLYKNENLVEIKIPR